MIPNQTLNSHLGDLRRCVIRSLIWCACGTGLGLFFVKTWLVWITRPLDVLGPYPLYFFAPHDAFVVQIKLALGGGLVFSSPAIFWELWRFIAPGLLEQEKKLAFPLVLCAGLLFAAGVLFSYHFILPFGLKFLLGFRTSVLQPMLSVKDYVHFCLMVLLGGGVMLLSPLLLWTLVRLKLTSTAFLRRQRKLAAIVILVLSAVVTPPDVVTQVMLAIPMYLLYEITIIVCDITCRSRD